jgi:uncharacterized protein (DUF983 family)
MARIETLDARDAAPDQPARPWRQSVGRGLHSKCPACGNGRLFGKFLKPVANCAACGEDYTHQRADDFPPYIVIILLGHILAPIAVFVELAYHPPMWIYMTFGSALIVALALLLLQPVKGGVIAHQWVLRMHGFEGQG